VCIGMRNPSGLERHGHSALRGMPHRSPSVLMTGKIRIVDLPSQCSLRTIALERDLLAAGDVHSESGGGLSDTNTVAVPLHTSKVNASRASVATSRTVCMCAFGVDRSSSEVWRVWKDSEWM
jgi:hypothetical protein